MTRNFSISSLEKITGDLIGYKFCPHMGKNWIDCYLALHGYIYAMYSNTLKKHIKLVVKWTVDLQTMLDLE